MWAAVLTIIAWYSLLRFLSSYWKCIYQGFKGFILGYTINLRKFGEWVVITGATDGIGKAYAFEFAKRGLNIVLISRSTNKLNSVKEEIQKCYKVDVKCFQADFGSMEIYEGIEKELSGLDVGILVNNVGVQYHHPMYFGEVPVEELKQMMNINVSSVLYMTHMLLPRMRQKRNGCIVNISSGSNMGPLPFMNVYAASKVFGSRFSEALRQEYSNQHITVQTVSPFYVSTKINHFSNELRSNNMFIPDTNQYAASAVKTIGVMDHTTGYLPHSIQYFVSLLLPEWVRTYVGGLLYKKMRWDYLKQCKQDQ